MNEHLPPKLGQLLVRSNVSIGSESYTVNVPADWDTGRQQDAARVLGAMPLADTPALQAFLSLTDVSLGSERLLASFNATFAGSFPDEESALRALSPLEDWENSLADWCIDNGVETEALDWNYKPLLARLREVYDLVELKGVYYAFAT